MSHPTAHYLKTHPQPLIAARFVERPHRFCTLCDVEPDGPRVKSHLADPGRLKALLVPGARLHITGPFGPPRKLPYSTLMVEAPESGALVNLVTTLPNTLAPDLLRGGHVPSLLADPEQLERIDREVRTGHSRIDLRLHTRDDPRPHWVELKGCGLRRGDFAMFPDAPSKRAAKHLDTLIARVADGDRASVLFVVGRGDVARFAPADHIDPDFARALRVAAAAGVAIHAVRVTLDTVGVFAPQPIPVHLAHDEPAYAP